MKKILTISLILLVSIFITGCTLVKTPFTGSSNKVDTQTATETQKPSSNVIKGSMFDLLKQGLPLKCTYIVNTGDTQAIGTIFASGGRSRSDYILSMSGQTIEQASIFDGTDIYSWTLNDPNNKMGFKMTVNPDQLTASSNNDQVKKMQEQTNFTCLPWVVDSSKFDLPTDINFGDLSTGTNKSQICGACGALPNEEQKAACLKGLGCN